MKGYFRVLASATILAVGLSSAAVFAQATQNGTSTDSSTKAKRKRKSKATDTAPAPATAAVGTTPSQAAPAGAPPAAPAAPATPAAPKVAKTPAPINNASAGDITSAQSSGKVWVNTESGVYHKGGRWYGKTKQGKFMTEDEAKKAGYHEAKAEIGNKKS